MRKFYLQNAAGERKRLNGEDGIRFCNPSGLGISLSQQYADIGSGFFRNKNNPSEPQKPVTGDIVFTKRQYETYNEFVTWIAAAGTLLLVYCPIGSTEFYRRVEVGYLTKTERGAGGFLTCPVSFNNLTPWYLPAPLRVDLASPSASAARYPYRYTAALRYGNSAGNMAADIEPSGHYPAALKITYTGEATNPVIKLTGASGRVYGQCKLTATLGATDTLELSTAYLDSYIRKVAADGEITDLLDKADIALEPFFKIPLNEPCALKITADDALTGTAKAQIYYYFRTV